MSLLPPQNFTSVLTRPSWPPSFWEEEKGRRTPNPQEAQDRVAPEPQALWSTSCSPCSGHSWRGWAAAHWDKPFEHRQTPTLGVSGFEVSGASLPTQPPTAPAATWALPSPTITSGGPSLPQVLVPCARKHLPHISLPYGTLAPCPKGSRKKFFSKGHSGGRAVAL